MASARLSSRDSAASRSLCLEEIRPVLRRLRRQGGCGAPPPVPATALQRLSIGVSFGRDNSVFIRGDDERVGGAVVVPVAQRGGGATRGVEFTDKDSASLGAPRRSAPL